MTVLNASEANSRQGGPSFSLTNRLTRLAWMITWALLARWTPRQLNGWRCALARLFGAKVERGAMIHGRTIIWLPSNFSVGRGTMIGPGVNIYCQGPISIGRDSVISQGSHLCAGTHDHRDPAFQLITKPITIGDRVWIAAESFVGPGVTVGDGAVLSARGVAFKDLKPWTMYTGNPAQLIGPRDYRG